MRFNVRFQPVDFILFGFEFPITDFGHLRKISLPLVAIGIQTQLFHVLFGVLKSIHAFLFTFPLGRQRMAFFFQQGHFLLQQLLFFARFFLFKGDQFDFYLTNFAVQRIQLFGFRIDFHPQFGRCFINQVNGFVGQKTVRDVPMRKFYRPHNGFVLDAHLVVVFIAFLNAPQNRNGTFHIGLVHQDFLKTAFEGFVFFKIFLKLIVRCCPNGAKFAPRQGGF